MTSQARLKKAWNELKLGKDIGIKHIPTNHCQVFWPTDEFSLQELGQVISAYQTQEEPQLYYKADPDKKYLVMLIDPDAPSCKLSRANENKHDNWLHWVKVNVPGTNTAVGETTVTYVPAGPPEGTGAHRYVLLVFEQVKSVKWPRFDWLQKTVENRENFNFEKFFKTFGKYLASNDPVSTACWRAEFDSSVPKLYDVMKFNYDVMPRNLLKNIHG